MAKLKSTLPNMLMSLTMIAAVAAVALAGVYMLTEKPIDEAKAKKQQEAIMEVLPKLDSTYFAQGDSLRIATPDTVYNTEKVDSTKIDTISAIILHKAYVGKKWVGTAVEATSKGNKNTPFGDTFNLMVGFDTEGNIVQYEVLSQKETPGLGAKMDKWFKNEEKPNQNILGRNPAAGLTVSKDGGSVDAITASTITSRAFLEVVERAYQAIAQQPMLIETASTPAEAEGTCPKGNNPATCNGCKDKHCQKTEKGGKQ